MLLLSNPTQPTANAKLAGTISRILGFHLVNIFRHVIYMLLNIGTAKLNKLYCNSQCNVKQVDYNTVEALLATTLVSDQL